MARGIRKSKKEKLEEKLAEIKESLIQYNKAIETLKEQEESIISELEQEASKEVLQLLTEHNMTVDDMKVWLNSMEKNKTECAATFTL